MNLNIVIEQENPSEREHPKQRKMPWYRNEMLTAKFTSGPDTLHRYVKH